MQATHFAGKGPDPLEKALCQRSASESASPTGVPRLGSTPASTSCSVSTGHPKWLASFGLSFATNPRGVVGPRVFKSTPGPRGASLKSEKTDIRVAKSALLFFGRATRSRLP